MKGRDLLDAMEYISDDLIEEAATDWVQKGTGRKFTMRKWVAAAAGIAVLCVSVLALNQWKQAMFSSQSNNSNTSGADGMNFSSSVTADTAAKAENASAEEETPEGNMAAAGGIDQSASSAADMQTAYDEAQKKNSSQDGIEEAVEQERAFIIEEFPPKYPYREPSEALTEEVASYVPPEKGTCSYSLKLTGALAYYDGEGDSTGSANVYHVGIKLFSDRKENGNVVYGEIELHEDSESLLAKEYERLSEQGYDVSLSEDYELEGLFTKSELETFEALPEYGYMFSLVSE